MLRKVIWVVFIARFYCFFTVEPDTPALPWLIFTFNKDVAHHFIKVCRRVKNHLGFYRVDILYVYCWRPECSLSSVTVF